MGWIYAAKTQSKSLFYATNHLGGSMFQDLQMLTQTALLKYLKSSLSKGTTFINSANGWIRMGFFPLTLLPRGPFIQLMRNVAELTSGSKSHQSQDGFSLHSETFLLVSV